MPPNTVYVGRPTIWGNPWVVGRPGRVVAAHTDDGGLRIIAQCEWNGGAPCGPITPDLAKEAYEWVLAGVNIRDELPPLSPEFGRLMVDCLERWRDRVETRLPELRGRDLACWCPLDRPCHADVLLELANA